MKGSRKNLILINIKYGKCQVPINIQFSDYKTNQIEKLYLLPKMYSK